MLEDLKLGTIILIQEEENTSPLPLEHTAVSGKITGPVATITVEQRFGNPFEKPIELEYLFPLPHEAAIVDYEITIGARTIKAELKEAGTARQVYEEARDMGKRASLLEQRRPNLFSIEIANVQPGEKIVTRVQYDERLKFSDNTYEFVFPMGITPRYHRAEMTPDEAKSVTAPLALNESEVAPVDINLEIEAGLPISTPQSPSHTLTLSDGSEGRPSVSLHTKPMKDFVLRYKVTGDQIQPAILSSKNEESETLIITLIPPPLELSQEPASREFIFVLDRSGSMNGGPIEQAKNALRACIRALSERDTFMIQTFDNTVEWFNEKALPVSQKSVDKADEWLNHIHGRGGTEILPAIESALAVPVDPTRQRYVVFLTDGAVSADEQAIRKINQQRKDARIFTFGIGPSVNRYLLDKIAQFGRGKAEFIGLQDDIETTITRFQDRVSYPVLQDIQLEWQGAEPWDTYPDVLPDLYVGEPLEILTRFQRKSGKTTLKLQGKRNGQAFEQKLPIPRTNEKNDVLPRLWARARIEALLDQQHRSGQSEKIREQVISLALEYRLASPYTSFVAVDSEVTDTQGAEKIRVSVPLPEGLKLAGFVDRGLMQANAYASAPMAYAPPTALHRYSAAPAQAKTKAGGGNTFDKLVGAVKSFLGGDSDLDGSEVRTFAMAERSRRVLGFEDRGTVSMPVQELPNIEERLKWLARTQKVDGGWGNQNTERTAAALLAFVRAGHTTRTGNYRRQVDKAARWLLAHLKDGNKFEQLLAARSLRELHAASGDHAVPEEVNRNLPAPTSVLEQATSSGSPITIPAAVNTLDELRITALVNGNATAPESLRRSADGDLVETWLALGTSK